MRHNPGMPEIVLPDEPLLDGPTALRAWRDSDVDAIVAACQDPEIVRWTRVPERYGEVDAQAYLLERYHATHAGASAPFAIVASSDLDVLLGSISILRVVWEHLRAEVGYWLAPQARGQGHATRALTLISRWAFDALGLERIDLLAATGNLPSQHVAERAGYSREGVLRSYMEGADGRQDMVAFGLLARAG
ncbi:MAG TPA: GNAT family N-acetyltransferase [Solirubrobacteraceae bacterium]|nr:GNAT family N-acetyltransferase [Solirubrobacteraceae bacterium]